MRLKGKTSQSTFSGDIDLEPGVTALPHAARYHGQIHVTHEFDQRSVNDGRASESDSQKDLFPKYPIQGPRR